MGLLRELADEAKERVDRDFVEVVEAIEAEETDWIVTSPPARRIFRLKNPHSSSESYSWTSLEIWKYYERAIWHGEAGDMDEVVQCFIIAEHYEDLHDELVSKYFKGLMTRKIRLKPANYAKRQKRSIRVKRAKELVENGTLDSYWKASFVIAEEEEKSQGTVWKSIKHLRQEKQS